MKQLNAKVVQFGYLPGMVFLRYVSLSGFLLVEEYEIFSHIASRQIYGHQNVKTVHVLALMILY